MLRVPREITEKYPSLPSESVCDAVEIAAIRALTQVLNAPVTASMDDDGILRVHLLREGQQEEISIQGLNRRVKRRLLDEMEIELMRRQACREASDFATIRGSVVTGVIERIYEDGTLGILVEVIDLLTPISIYAECPVQQQPLHERLTYRTGETMEFFVTSCLPVSNGRHAKVRVIVSRAARELPSRLLGKLTGLSGIRCTKRIPGGYSRIIAKHWIPKSAINTVGKELKEHLDVTCLTKQPAVK